MSVEATQPRRWLRRLLPVVVLAAGAGGALWLWRHPIEVARRTQPVGIAQIHVSYGQWGRWPAPVHTTGTVRAERELGLVSKLPGKVEWVWPGLEVGARVAEGTVLVRIDDADQRHRLRESTAAVRAAERALAHELSLARIAAHDWRDRQSELEADQREMALRIPHVASARADLDAARSREKLARADLQALKVRAPFDAVVRASTVEIGQWVTQAQVLVALVGAGRYQVVATVAVDRLSHLKIPGVAGFAEARGSSVVVRQRARGQLVGEYVGHIAALSPEVDARVRTGRIIVHVDDPLDPQAQGHDDFVPLMLGSFVELELQGDEVEGLRLPGQTLGVDGRIWPIRGGADAARLIDYRPTLLWRGPAARDSSSGGQVDDWIVLDAPPILEFLNLQSPEELAGVQWWARPSGALVAGTRVEIVSAKAGRDGG